MLQARRIQCIHRHFRQCQASIHRHSTLTSMADAFVKIESWVPCLVPALMGTLMYIRAHTHAYRRMWAIEVIMAKVQHAGGAQACNTAGAIPRLRRLPPPPPLPSPLPTSLGLLEHRGWQGRQVTGGQLSQYHSSKKSRQCGGTCRRGGRVHVPVAWGGGGG